MKLAEALQERAAMKRKMDELRSCIESNALIQEGDTPELDVKALLAEFEQTADAWCRLLERINVTNCAVRSEAGESMTSLLARRDALKEKRRAFEALQDELGRRTRRVARSEIRIVAAVSAADVKKASDDLSKELRLLDNEIQKLNWQADLIED